MAPTNSPLPEHRPHSHTFGQDSVKPGERKTLWVIVLTAVTMVVEIIAGIVFGSMALLADGLHMASHTSALGITAVAYIYARRHALDRRYSFGTGKVNALAGFSGAILLAVFALIMAGESLRRLASPVPIAFNEAILVSVVGLLVNGVSVWILGAGQHGGHDHSHHQGQHHEHGDHSLRSAYLHVMADALTSLLAIFALLAAKYFGAYWMDPAMGLVGAVLITRWSVGLLKSTSAILLDREAPDAMHTRVAEALTDENTRVADLHIWCIGPDVFAVIAVLVTRNAGSPDYLPPEYLSPEYYKAKLPPELGLEHVSIEIHDEAREVAN